MSDGNRKGSVGERFWENHYQGASGKSNGKPSTLLERYASNRTPGRALDLGCARGDDAVWLAKQGWQVTGVDVSETVLEHARANAVAAGVDDTTEFVRIDLATDFPPGRFDLVSALYLESPVEFPRYEVLNRAARAVSSKGLLLVALHGSRAPWSWADPDTVYPKPEAVLEKLSLDPEYWSLVFVSSPEREARGPNGQKAMVLDTVIALQRIRPKIEEGSYAEHL